MGLPSMVRGKGSDGTCCQYVSVPYVPLVRVVLGIAAPRHPASRVRCGRFVCVPVAGVMPMMFVCYCCWSCRALCFYFL